MLKKVFYLLFLLSLQLGIFVQPIFAVSSCKDAGIDWDPKIFLENASGYNLTFTISNQNTFNTLTDSSVYLLLDKGILDGGSPTSAINVQDKTFSWGLDGDQKTRKIHNGTLRWLPKGESGYKDFCSDVTYQVGSLGACTIDPSLPSNIPPNVKTTIKFVGKTETEYQLRIVSLANPTLAKATTDTSGQGEFRDVVIPGNNGDVIKLTVTAGGAAGTRSCDKTFTIDPKAAPPATVPAVIVAPIPVAPAAPSVTSCTGAGCTKGGGDPCDIGGTRGPGINTAIGCIHTNPQEFVKDFMKFVIAIAGGLAFLLMLLGAFQMVTSAGNPDSLNAGRERLTQAIIGLLFVIFAVLFMQIIGVGILNIPGFK